MIRPYLHWHPQIADSAFLADSADIIGRVSIGADSSIWYQAVLRGDVHDIMIGERSNIQDHSILHTSHHVSPCIVGNDVTIGHRVILHGCEIQDGCLVGMGSIIMDKAVLESGCFLAAGSLVSEGKILRGGYLYAGAPARERRPLTDEEKLFLARSAGHYVQVAHNHRKP
ncbi:MAG TPA: gamma carbonic anhydrase family protein [Mariprofundaceae bacterium]|nr:gamma carbonic anhydrase family protein [Mariprofundaceae bacterium]